MLFENKVSYIEEEKKGKKWARTGSRAECRFAPLGRDRCPELPSNSAHDGSLSPSQLTDGWLRGSCLVFAARVSQVCFNVGDWGEGAMEDDAHAELE